MTLAELLQGAKPSSQSSPLPAGGRLNSFQGLFALPLALNEVYLNYHRSTSGLVLKSRFYPVPEGPDYRYAAPTGPELFISL